MAISPEVKRIPLGSGKLYVAEFTGDVKTAISNMKALITAVEKDENELGRVSGGASIEYKAEFYTAEDDLGTVSRTIMTTDEATLKGGICTWNGDTLKKLCSTARVTEDAENNLRIVKIGGVKNYDGKLYVIMFVNDDKDFGKTYVTIVGNNQAGFTFEFVKDKETVVNPEFKAMAADSDGTKIIYAETIDPTK